LGTRDTVSDDASGRFLGIYLRDHYAAAGGGADLARHLARDEDGEMQALAREIAADREVLGNIMGVLGVRSNAAKTVVARLGGKLSRLKPNGSLRSRSPLDRVIELETLSVGIVGKRALWRSLIVAERSRLALAGIDLDRLVASADAQYERVERRRLDAVAVAFGSNDRVLPSVIPGKRVE
jgi:hypothetical protein